MTKQEALYGMTTHELNSYMGQVMVNAERQARVDILKARLNELLQEEDGLTKTIEVNNQEVNHCDLLTKAIQFWKELY